MLRIASAWPAGYAGVILLMAIMVNLATQLERNGYGLILPSMRDSLGLSYSQAGSLITAIAFLGMAASLTFGMLAPRYGSRFIIGICAIAAGIGMVFLGSAPNFLFALVMSALIGFVTGGCSTPMMGLLLMWFDAQKRGTVAGLAIAGGSVSFIIIGALVPWLTGRDPENGWRHTWYFLAAIIMVAGVLSLLFLRERPREAAGTQKIGGAWPIAAYRNRLVWVVTFLAFWSGWCNGLYTTFFGIYLKEQGVSLATSGQLWGLVGLLGIGSGVFWGNVSDRLGRRIGFLLSFAILGVGCLLFWIMPVLVGFVASAALFGMSSRAGVTICAAASGDYVSPRFAAAAFGLMGVGAGFGSATGPLIGGRIADVTGDLSWVFALAAVSAAVAVFGSMFLRRPRSVS